MIVVALSLGYQLNGRLPSSAEPPSAALPETIAYSDIRVTDGDTFRLGAERIRIANIDTPEMPGRAACAYEADKALAAKARLAQILAGGEIVIARDGVDRYGRTLATLRVNGRDVGEQLVAEGAAQRWQGHKAQWCEAA
ncbi:MAG: thermonuclease family protein [Caulobacteraceae bacterium]|nr:thermonuclease family protein [Caulobacteraceae bacterium]